MTLALGPSDIAVHMLPMYHIGAIVDLLLAPLSTGGGVHFAHPIATENLRDALLSESCTWMQGVPTMLINLAAACSDTELAAIGRKLRFVRSVSSDLSAERQSELEARFSGIPIIAMYGMTETAGQIASNPLPPARRRPGSVGLANGAEILIADAFGNPVETGLPGEIFVAGPTTTPGYEGVPRIDHFVGRWLRTGDTGRIDADGYLWLTGRVKDIINRGGEKIAPQEIDRALMAHPAVAEAAAFGVPHPSLGEEVAVAVTMRRDCIVEPVAMRAALAERLAPHKCPRRIVVLDTLPKLGSGKIDRNALRRMFADSANAAVEEEIATPLGKRLFALWCEVLKRPHLALDDDFFDQGGDSLLATTLMLTLEQEFGKSIPANLLYEAPTLRQFEQLFDQLVSPPYEGALPAPVFSAVKSAMTGWGGRRTHSWSLVAGHNGASEGQPFFWCSAGVEQWQHVVDASAGDRPIYLLRSLSGLSVKSAANTTLLAEHYADEIMGLHPQGAIALGGFCQGAVVTRQIAENLRARGRTIALHVVVDRRFDTPDRLPTVYFWGRDNVHSGAAVFTSPELALPRLHPAGAVSFNLDYDHGDLTAPIAAKTIMQRVTQLLASGLQVTLVESCGETPSGDDVMASIIAPTPFWAAPGQPLQLDVTVRNSGNTAWRRGPHKSYRLAARWSNLDGYPRVLNAASVDLPAVVLPGESVALQLPVAFPERGLPMMLLLDVVDEGVFWFHERTGRSFRRLVLCKGLPRRAAKKFRKADAGD
ncbi:AMP-binding protein [Devosia algicola]|uniref:AMP-binding protein n=1 Tax=Devosia algicola TaxID=3026418 RepID=A0ABY7YKL4_9HYPH|nr:AMP-binding protein [Devosia algicola]